MHKPPKLKVKSFLDPELDFGTLDLEQARDKLDYEAENIILLEGQLVNSHEELVRLASQDEYKDKELLEVTLLPYIVGG